MAGKPGVTKVGAVGFSEGAQNVLLAAGFTGFPNQNVPLSAVLAFSPPADQNTQQVDNPITAAALTEVVAGSTPLCLFIPSGGVLSCLQRLDSES